MQAHVSASSKLHELAKKRGLVHFFPCGRHSEGGSCKALGIQQLCPVAKAMSPYRLGWGLEEFLSAYASISWTKRCSKTCESEILVGLLVLEILDVAALGAINNMTRRVSGPQIRLGV